MMKTDLLKLEILKNQYIKKLAKIEEQINKIQIKDDMKDDKITGISAAVN